MSKAEYRCLCVSCTELETKGSKLLWSSTGSAPDRGFAVVAITKESGLRRSVSHRVVPAWFNRGGGRGAARRGRDEGFGRIKNVSRGN